MKRFLMLVAGCMAVFLLVAPVAVYAQHDDPNMEWEDSNTDVAAKDTNQAIVIEKPPRVYDRWGGETAIKSLVSEFSSIVLADERIKNHFKGINLAQWRLKLVGELSDAAGGPVYLGKSLKQEHLDMGLSDTDLQSMKEDLAQALDWLEFKQPDKDQLLIALGMKERPRAVDESGE